MTHRDDIEDVLHRYAHAYDDRDAEGVGATFAEDGELSLRISGGDLVGPWSGRAAVVAMMAATLATQEDQRRHLASTFTLDACDGATARARSYLTLVAVAGGELRVLTTGRYVDELVRGEDGWLIRRRHIELDLPY